MPVGTRRFGRLGNELYQLAAVIGYAKKHGLEWSAPNITNDEKWNPCHFRHLYNPKWVNGIGGHLVNELWNTEQHYQEIPFKEEWRNSQIVLNGYWQSYKYFDFMRDELLEILNFPYECNKGVCSIHIRRGDYLLYPTLHPVCPIQYYKAAMLYIWDNTNITDFIVYSDDIKWCKENINNKYFGGFYIEYSEDNTEMEDLTLMSHCEHQICSNSTMATWGAELNQNPNKIVIVPHESNWFGIDNQKKMTIKDMYRPEWVRIKY